MKQAKKAPPGWVWVYSPFVTRNGRRIYASAYGRRVFAFLVPTDKKR